MNTFILHWRDGKKERVYGWTIKEAVQDAGIGHGAMNALDYWEKAEIKFEEIPKPEHGTHMTKEEFIENCRFGGFINSDGFGCYATETQITDKYVRPSDLMTGDFDPDWSHIVWFNR